MLLLIPRINSPIISHCHFHSKKFSLDQSTQSVHIRMQNSYIEISVIKGEFFVNYASSFLVFANIISTYTTSFLNLFCIHNESNRKLKTKQENKLASQKPLLVFQITKFNTTFIISHLVFYEESNIFLSTEKVVTSPPKTH